MPRQRKDSSSSSESEGKKSKTPMGEKKRSMKKREETLEHRKGMKLIPKTKTVMDTKELIKEHEKLIKVLKSGEGKKGEIKAQSAELKKYQKKIEKKKK
jgi:hypothetical protein